MSKLKNPMNLFLTLLLTLSIVLPSTLIRVDAATAMSGLITSVAVYNQKPVFDENGTLTPQGDKIQDVRPDVNKEVAVIYSWDLADNHGYQGGDTYTFSLPSELQVPSRLTGSLTGGVGDFVVETDGTVTFTFNDSINGGVGYAGYFYVWLKFDQSNLGDGLEHEIDFNYDGKTTAIPVHFANTATDGLKKTAQANKNNFNSDEIVWTLEFNQGENEIKNAQLTDTLPSGLTLKGNIQICKMQVQLDGSLKSKVPSDCTTETAFPVALGDINNAYRVTYTTSVAAPTTAPFTNVEYANSASLTGNNITEQKAVAKTTISFNEPLKKKILSYDSVTQSVYWKVEYNYNQQSISQTDAWMEDTFDTAEFELIPTSLKVYEVTINANGTAGGRSLVDSSQYSVQGVGTGFDGGFKLKFNEAAGITKAYDIEYALRAVNRVYVDRDVSNTVTTYNATKILTQRLKEVIFAKSVNKEDFQNKIITWNLVINQDQKDMSDIVITDDYAGMHMKLAPASIQVTGADPADFVLEVVSGDTNYESGFRLKLKTGVVIQDKVVITYTTSFDPTAGMPPGNKYTNTGTINWKESGVSQTAITKSAAVTPQDYTINNGKKKGEYNAADKTILWTIDVNYNLYDIQDAIIKDHYTATEGSQALVTDSLTVNKLELQSGNNTFKIGDPVTLTDGQFVLNPDGQGFVLKLGNIGKTAYRIQYKTKLNPADGYKIAGSYSNGATLQDSESGTPIFNQSATVTPMHGGKYIDKTGKQEGTTDRATWTVNINPSQSYVAAGSVVTDTLSDNQILLADSFKLYKTSIPADNSGNVSTKAGLVDAADYELNVTGNTFTITFKNALTTAYLLEYQSFINADDGERIGNNVQFAGQSKSVIGSDGQQGVKVALADAGGGTSTGNGQIQIVKTDDRDQPLPGVKFELYNAAGTTLLETLVTDADGKAITKRSYRLNKTTGLPYTLKEVSAPSGYLVDPDYSAGKKISFKDSAVPFKIVNKKIRQGFELIKTDAADPTKKLEGAIFELRDTTDTVVDTLTTGTDGRIAKGDLPAGNYKLTEIKAPQFYDLDATPIPFTIVANQTEIVKLSKTNVRGSNGTLTITKVNAKNQSVIEGVEFELRDASDVVVATGKTDVNGVVQFTNLSYGQYKLVETKADGYVIEQPETDVAIDKSLTVLTIENKENVRSVRLKKFNADKSAALQGAVFELKARTPFIDLDGNDIYEKVTSIDASKLTTDLNGEFMLEDLPPNRYQLVEIQAPAGYKLDQTPVDFVITNTQITAVSVEKTNVRIPSSGGGGGTPSDPPKQPDPEKPTDPDKPKDPEKPTDPEKPVVPEKPVDPNKPVDPEKPVDPGKPGNPEKPAKPKENVTTPENKPKTGEVVVPEGGKAEISEKPKHGTVTVDPDGKWKYTPNKGYTGKDTFTIVVTDKDGNQEEVLVEVDVQKVPRGGATGAVPGKTLPKTGEESHLPMQLAGLGLVVIGGVILLLRRRQNRKA
ncbi:LPXTG cell wall anchor domain-containing protein [Cohnella sp. CFH 77786]|uniref:SpaA isopeptide-forming pilin-related protein n=1 Tax=Cohnella sp. CFH 77786 TaxID=2662265 RepID=UPI001C60B84F|nr:SpaA isopeptide-forming pilin-related protein [Cohnella sp. CFH 77786]MBW5446710.1 LPXTG cell wall anchor domain-containing protein [Cohnella sp. CFH 77786]